MTSNRIFSSLCGIATGDAIGKQTENLSFADIPRWYPAGIGGFEGDPGSVIPRYVGNAKCEWRIGETTDDTERTIAVARAILSEQAVSHEVVGRFMLACTKSVHPGVRSLWEFHQAGDPARVAQHHDGCGAAIRVAPVGMFYSPEHLDALVTGVFEASISTHGGGLAIAAAAATAGAVSAAVAGASQPAILEMAIQAAQRAESRWLDPAGRKMSAAICGIYDDLREWERLDPERIATTYFPDNPMTIVPLAIGLGTVMPSAGAAILLAANVGGDSDSVASIAGGILGAAFPQTLNRGWYAVVESVNGHDLGPLAKGLARLRR